MSKRSLAITFLLALSFVALVTCRQPLGDQPSATPAPTEGVPARSIHDGAHDGVEKHFFFLPPMVSMPSVSGTFLGTLSPVVTVIDLESGSVVKSFTSGQPEGGVRLVDDHYQVDWHTAESGLQADRTYRVIVEVPVGTSLIRLGHADLDVVGSGRDLKNVVTSEYVPLLDDRTLPIKFRIEEGARINPPVAAFAVSPPQGPAPLGVAVDASASSDADGDPMTFEWTFGDGATGSGITAGHVYATPGTYTLSLIVKDGHGGEGSASAELVVEAPLVHRVTYDGNGATAGAVPDDPTRYLPGALVPIPGNPGALAFPGKALAGWNTKADGSGITYRKGQDFIMGVPDITLHAVWIPASSGLAYTSTGAAYSVKAGTAGDGAVIIPVYWDTEPVTAIAAEGFAGCAAMTSVNIPGSVTSLGDRAFDGCAALSFITIPEGVIQVGDHAFRDCSAVQSVYIPASATTFGDRILEGSTGNVNTVTILSAAYPLANEFSHLFYLTSATVATPAVPPYAFSACPNLSSLSLLDSVTAIGDSAFADCWSLASVAVPQGVTAIGRDAFRGCRSLANLDLPASLVSIGDYAFEDCVALPAVTLPDAVASIGSFAFRNCPALATVYVRPYSPPTAGTGLFEGHGVTFGIHVPSAGVLGAYAGAPGWNEYAAYLLYP